MFESFAIVLEVSCTIIYIYIFFDLEIEIYTTHTHILFEEGREDSRGVAAGQGKVGGG